MPPAYMAARSLILGGHRHDTCRTPARHRAFRPPCHVGGRPARSGRRARDPRRARQAPNAVYALVQTALVQDEALKHANARIQELEAQLGIGNEPPAPGRLSRQHARQHLRPAPGPARLGAERAAGRCADGSASGVWRTSRAADGRPRLRALARCRRSRPRAAAVRSSAPRLRPLPASSAVRCCLTASAAMTGGRRPGGLGLADSGALPPDATTAARRGAAAVAAVATTSRGRPALTILAAAPVPGPSVKARALFNDSRGGKSGDADTGRRRKSRRQRLGR